MTMWAPRLDRDDGPLYLRIARAIRKDIESGALTAGDRMPPQRELADRLGVTLGTVTRAMRELERNKLLVGEVGRGTFVKAAVERAPVHPLRLTGEPSDGFIDLGLNLPLSALDPPLGPVLSALGRDPLVTALLDYPPTRGHLRHREAGVAWLARHGVQASADEVSCCAGGQHALLVALSALVRPGDVVLSESLVFPGLRTLATLLDLRLEAVPSDAHGPLPDALADIAERTGAKALYATPTLNNPTTHTWTRERREAVAEVARAADLSIVEDEAYRRLASVPPPPLASFAPERTWFVAAMSKALGAGLRVAYLRAPAPQASAVAFSIASSVWTASPLSQEIAARWIDDGTAEETVVKKREEGSRRQALAARMLPAELVVAAPESHHLWLHLPPAWSSDVLVSEAARRGVLITGARAFAVGRGPIRDGVRLSLGAPRDHDQLARGVAVVAELLAGRPSDEICV